MNVMQSLYRAGGKPFTSTTEVMDGNGVIMFKQVTGEEQGSYICTATNAVGTVSLTISLRISGMLLLKDFLLSELTYSHCILSFFLYIHTATVQTHART